VDLEDIYDAYRIDPSFKHLRRRFNFVPGEGNTSANIMFVGEAPGRTEDREEKPFCGASGKVLNRMLESIDLKRDDCFVTNLLKYRPSTDNRDPTPQEIRDSLGYLGEEINSVNPRLIVTLGIIPARAFLPGNRFKNIKGTVNLLAVDLCLLVTYHPAYISYNHSAEAEYLEHFALIKGFADDKGSGDGQPS